jgi:GWxTD domain-containing protein
MDARRTAARCRLSAPGLARAVRLALAVVAGAVAVARAESTNPLQEATDKWRSTRGSDLPLEVYLRPLVAADPGFRADTTGVFQTLGPEIRAVYEGLHDLLTPSMKAQFLGLSSDSLRAEWVRRYWKFRDPTPTTPENERLQVHERRVAEAKRLFAWKKPPGWDDRGRIWIQFGEPDSTIEETASIEDGLGFVPAHQEWLYLRERWVVEFECRTRVGRGSWDGPRPSSPTGPIWSRGTATGSVTIRRSNRRARAATTAPPTSSVFRKTASSSLRIPWRTRT